MAVTSLRAGDPEQVGRYRIVGRLGRGGMGQVYLGRSPSGRAVAVKVVRAALTENPGFRHRFAREVAAARRVTGFFTAAVADAEPDGAAPWLATAYVPGMALDAAVARHGAWPERSVLALGAALAEALEAVHGADVVHRDLKPSNVLLAADGPRVIDFGISLVADATKITEPGLVMGTPGFISPEQLLGGHAEEASDVFAFGAVLAFAAIGSGPFGVGRADALNYRVVHEEPDLTDLPPGVKDVVARCLAKDPRQRPTVPHLVTELAQASQPRQADGYFAAADWLPEPVAAEIEQGAERTIPTSSAMPTPLDDPQQRGPSRRRIVTGLAVTAVLALLVTTALLTGHLSGHVDGGQPEGPDKEANDSPAWTELWSYALKAESFLEEVADGRAYVASDEGLYALDADNGGELWTRRYPAEYGGSVLGTSSGVVYYGDETHMYALDARSGDELWQVEHFGFYPSVTVVSGIIYLDYGVALEALDSRTLELVWFKREIDSNQDPVISDGRIHFTGRDGALFAVDAETGDSLWEFEANTGIVASPVVADGTVYVGSGDGALYAVNADTGRERWRYSFDGELWDPAIAFSADPALVDHGVVYFENDVYVCAFSARTGRLLWHHRPHVDDVELLSLANGAVHFIGGEDTLYALDANTGKRLWEDNLGENLVIVGDTIYFEAGARLHAVSTQD
ncbi:outer membrane protein assembly factor BamB family protein [Streptomyces sp. 4N509B]|uniref:outer membrane protein assembly factor BamB family protein n=1 Tax=Streptomyces sp. 4N509B TaxID=3457413 RepID=UPI003FD1A76A